MAEYSVRVLCPVCGSMHPMGIMSVESEGDTQGKNSETDDYSGKPVPEELAKIKDHIVKCPKTGKTFTQKDNSNVYLFPT